MTMWIRAIVTLLGIAFGLVACGQPQTAKPPQAAQYSWLDESACRPPCWEGITPGVTTVTATADLLKANPTIQHVRVTDLAYVNHDGEHEIRWGWTPPSPSTRGGYAFALNGSFMIDHVGLFLDTPVAFASV